MRSHQTTMKSYKKRMVGMYVRVIITKSNRCSNLIYKRIIEVFSFYFLDHNLLSVCNNVFPHVLCIIIYTQLLQTHFFIIIFFLYWENTLYINCLYDSFKYNEKIITVHPRATLSFLSSVLGWRTPVTTKNKINQFKPKPLNVSKHSV